MDCEGVCLNSCGKSFLFNVIECYYCLHSHHIIDIVYTMIMDLETCTDAIQNQDELGIDCGGTCPESCGRKMKYLYHTRCIKMIHCVYFLHQYTIYIQLVIYLQPLSTKKCV